MNNSYLNGGYSSSSYPNGMFAPQMKVPVVNGREGANAFRIGVDSQVILLDISGKLIWIVSTDSAGYKTIQAYSITPYVEPQPPDYNVVMNKINQMEEMLNGLLTAINNNGATAKSTSNSQSTAVSADTNANDPAKQF